MSTTTKSAASKKRSSSSSRRSRAPAARGSETNAVRLLTTDHREVKALFQQYQELVDHDADDEEKQPLAEHICALLTVHAQVEEEIFYPAAKEAIKEPDLVAEAAVEHASAKDLIAQIEDSDPSEELYDAKVKVLGEYIEHHVKEEEGQLFPQVRRAKLDLEGVGKQLMQRKQALMQQMGLSGAGDENGEDEE
ncbi:MAG TPA: hemerythrin domain-containing protein [Burkholderiaceae bacterium]